MLALRAEMEWRHGTWQCGTCHFKLGCCEGEPQTACDAAARDGRGRAASLSGSKPGGDRGHRAAQTYRTTTGVIRRHGLEVEAVRGISFAVERGELFGLLGPNGAGKTTTIKMLITLLLPTAARRACSGSTSSKDAREVRKRIGYVFGGDRGLYERLSALDNLRYFAELYGVSGRAQRTRIDEVLELVGLKGREQERVEGYSRGMRQRLHIARGILHDPEVRVPRRADDRRRPRRRARAARHDRRPGRARQDGAADDALHVRGGRALRPDRRDREGPDRRRGHAGRAEEPGRRRHASPRSRSSASTTPAVERLSRSVAGVTAVDRRGARPEAAARRADDRASASSPQSLLGELRGVTVGRVASREPTLEDAYVALVTAED